MHRNTSTISRRAVLGLAAVGAIAAARMAATARTSSKAASTGAQALSVRYEWRNGTVAPPYHYEYTILLGPGTRGQMLLRPGYPSSTAKNIEWKETFTFSPASRDKLRATMHAHGVFTRSWNGATSGNHPVGGGSENLQVKASQSTFIIPAFLDNQAARADADAVYEAINALVPKAARARLEAKQKKLQNQALQAQIRG